MTGFGVSLMGVNGGSAIFFASKEGLIRVAEGNTISIPLHVCPCFGGVPVMLMIEGGMCEAPRR